MRPFVQFFERRFPLLRIPRELWALVILLVGVHLFSIFYLKENQYSYLNLGLLYQEFFQGKVWTILTYGLFHDPTSLTHLCFNILALLFFGGRVSFILDRLDFALVLLGGVICGGLVHLLEQSFVTEQSILIGLSGGLFALLAVLTTLSPDSRFWPGVRGIHLKNGLILSSLFFIVTNPNLEIPFLKEIGVWLVSITGDKIYYLSHSCHLGGLLFGWAYAAKKMRLPRLPKTFSKKIKFK